MFVNVERKLIGEEEMKKKCGNCKREREVSEDTIMVVCTCGHTIELKGGEEDKSL